MSSILWQAVSSDSKKGRKIGVMRGNDHDSYQFVQEVDNHTDDLVGKAMIYKTFATAGEAISAIMNAINNAPKVAKPYKATEVVCCEQLTLAFFQDAK